MPTSRLLLSRAPATSANRGPDEETAEACAGTRVVKRMAATQPGARKWARRYGASLVCVRYRHDAQGQHRYTTVELVVDDAPLARRAQLDKMVILDLAFDESELLQKVVTHGAEWDGELRVWRMSRRIAEQLGLLSRIVES